MRLAIILLSVSLPFPAAQFPLRGELGERAARHWNQLLVELVDTQRGGVVARAEPQPGGSFEFEIEDGRTYELRLVTPHGDVLQTALMVSSQSGPVTLEIPETRKSAPSGVVSVQQLAHPPNRKARGAYGKALAAGRDGNLSAAEQHLRSAVAADPGFSEARNELARMVLERGDAEAALALYRECVQHDPAFAPAWVNLAVVNLRLGRVADAESASQRAISLRPDSATAHYVRALAYREQEPKRGQALIELLRVAYEFPKARLAAAGLLVDQGRIVQAIGQLEAYLALPDAASRNEISNWLNELRVAVAKAGL